MTDRAQVLGLVAALLGAMLLRPAAEESCLAADEYEDVYYLPAPGWLRVMSLGHREALADLVWCRALIYQGEEFAHRGGVDHVFDYTEAMLALDPDFRAVYLWIGTAGVYQPGTITAGEVRRAISILERGRRRFPHDGELAWSLGATLNFELPPLLPESERAATRLSGVEHLMDAVRLNAAPQWLVLSNTSQLENLGRAERAAEHLEEMYASITDERVRAEIASRIEQVRSEAYGEAFVEANDQIEFARLRELPYVSESFYFLVSDDEESSWREAFRRGYGAGAIADLSLDADGGD